MSATLYELILNAYNNKIVVQFEIILIMKVVGMMKFKFPFE